MQFDWTTFALEIVNFLVLVWILQRFLYKPVTGAIAARKAAIDKTLADAQAVEGQATSLKRQYESRMAEWEHEKAQARVRLQEELDAERARLMDTLRASLDQERQKARVLEQRRAVETRHRLEEAALAEGGRFVARLLARIAGAELEERIRGLLLEDLARLADADLRKLRAACQEAGGKITIASAWPLAAAQRQGLVQTLSDLAGRPLDCTFVQDTELMAGLRIAIGPWMLRCNLRDELKFFTGAANAGG
jgi:F-type H+-transporting ATPase subunit b